MRRGGGISLYGPKLKSSSVVTFLGKVFLLDFVQASRGVGVNNFCCGLKQIHGFEGYVSNHPRNYCRLAVPSLPDALLCLTVLNPWRYFMKFQS